MLFNSFQYILFFPIVVALYFAAPFKHRWWLLLAASYYFYMCWRWEYVVLIIVQTEINYVCGRCLGRTSDPAKRRWLLGAALVSTLGILVFFKYYNFLNDSVRSVLAVADVKYPVPNLNILLPVGISFHTFQTLSYTIDVYRERTPVETHFGKFALYVSFFPLLVAGPIERSTRLLPQFSRNHHFDIDRAVSGMRLILWGLFKKVVIADRLAEYVNRIYAEPSLYSGATLLLATYFFAFQIYCDFSGYSDIAIGSARVLGFDMMQNFNLPYLAQSIGEFWQRWHISLSTWFRDYVYIPLGGSRVSAPRWALNVFVTFLLSGLWHGASWTFVIWGALHGSYYLLERILSEPARRLQALLRLPEWIWAGLRIAVTFHMVLLAWVFFRARTLGDAAVILQRVLAPLRGPLYLGPSQLATYVSLLLILALIGVMLLQHRGRWLGSAAQVRIPVGVRWAGYLAMLFGLAFLGKSGQDFIYFQF